MMLFQDGSKHAWLGQGPDLDLIVTIDDATSAITSIFLCEEEGRPPAFAVCRRRSARMVCSRRFYTDRGSHYFVTPKAGGKVDKTQLTQVGRALKQLHVEHIPSYSPQARGGWSGSGTRCRTSASAAEGERAHDDGGGQSLVGGGLSRATQRPLRRGRRGRRDSLHSFRGRTRQYPVHRGGARRQPGQHRPLRGPLPTNPPNGTGITSPRAPSACSNTGTAPSPCSMDRAKSPASMRTEP